MEGQLERLLETTGHLYRFLKDGRPEPKATEMDPWHSVPAQPVREVETGFLPFVFFGARSSKKIAVSSISFFDSSKALSGTFLHGFSADKDLYEVRSTTLKDFHPNLAYSTMRPV